MRDRFSSIFLTEENISESESMPESENVKVIDGKEYSVLIPFRCDFCKFEIYVDPKANKVMAKSDEKNNMFHINMSRKECTCTECAVRGIREVLLKRAEN